MMAPPPRVPTSSSRPDKDTTNTTDSSTASASSSSTISRDYGFTVSQVPENPLGGSRYIKTAAALIIGDEILNGKTLDQNTNYFARYCFDHGVELKRVEVIADDESEIIEASRRMVRDYDFVITSGGIGPTHDDITYASLAAAFGQSLTLHEETQRRMEEMNKYRPWVASQNPHQRAAMHRMAQFPENAEVLFVGKDIWVPVVRLEGKLCIFPGIPTLFQKMLTGLTPLLPLPPISERPLRIQVFTERPESMIAPYLTALQARLKPHGIRVGSYPVLGQGVFVSLIGRVKPTAETEGEFDNETDGPPSTNADDGGRTEEPSRIWLAEAAKEVEKEVGGRVVGEEDVAKKKEEVRRRAGIVSGNTSGLQVGATVTANFVSTVEIIKS